MKKLFLVNFTFQFRASPFGLIKCDVFAKIRAKWARFVVIV